jgi:hypothetical protein
LGSASRLPPTRRRLEACPSEQRALAEIRRLRKQGATVHGIVCTLNDGALLTRRGTAASVVEQSRLLTAGVPEGWLRRKNALDDPSDLELQRRRRINN